MSLCEFKVGESKICLVHGDITEQETDAIVNAANSTLMGGGGVDGAIHRKGGPQVLEECTRIKSTEWPEGIPTGSAVITSGGKLRTRHVIHAVGPVWRGGIQGEEDQLAQAYRNSLKLAVSKKLGTIAFPSISTGAYGFPIEKANRIAVSAVKKFLEREDVTMEVVFVLFTEDDLQTYMKSTREILQKNQNL